MKKSILAIELDDYALKIIKAKATQKGWFVDKFAISSAKGKSDDELSNLVKDTLRKLKIRKTKTTFIIPRSLVTVRYLNLPTINPNELKNMIDMQVVHQIPYTKEEMVYDYYVIGLTEDGYTKILLVIAHRDIIMKYLRILQKAEITPSFIELDSLATMNLCRFFNAGSNKLVADEKPTALLDIDYETTNIIVSQKDNPAFTRSVSIGASHLEGKIQPPAGKDWVTELVGEINRSLTVFQREQAVSIEKIILLGEFGGKFISALTGKLSFSLTSFSVNQYLEGISPLPSFNINEVNVSIISLLGAIREGDNTSINLVPEEIRDSSILKQKRQSLIIMSLLILGIIGTLGMTLNKKIDDRKEYLSLLENRLKETSPLAKELTVKKNRLTLIKKQLSVSGTSLDVLRELYNIIPQKTSLSLFVYDDVSGVTIKGSSPAMSEVFDLIPKLENSPYYENVTSRYATQRKIKGQELTDFHIDCAITVPQEGS